MTTKGTGRPYGTDEDFCVGLHSVMLALEPRFMFDAAVAATDAALAEQAAEAFSDACESEADDDEGSSGASEAGFVSAGDAGAYGMEPESTGIMAAAAKANEKAGLEVGDGSSGYTFNVDEDSVLRFTGENQIVISDAENDILVVTLEVENGVLNGSRVPGVIYEGLGTGKITLTGSAEAITEALRSVYYKGDQYYNSEDPRFGPESLTITVKDADASLQTPDRIIEREIEIYVNPVNNRPTVDQPDEINIEIEQDEVGSIPPIIISDPDYGDEITVTITTSNGILIFADGVEYEFQAKDIGSGITKNTYTIKGTVDEINSILADLGYKGEENFSGTDQIQLSVTDGKSAPVEPDPIDVLVTPVNQPPEIVGEPDTAVADEGGYVTLTKDNFNIIDPDSTDRQLAIRILEEPEYGDIYYQKIPNDDTSWVKLGVGSVFTLKDVDDGRIRYVHNGSQVQPDLNPSSAADGFRFSVSDSAGGHIADAGVSIALNPVNQAPDVTVEEYDNVRTDDTDGTHLVVWEGEHGAVIRFTVTDPDQDPDVSHRVVFTSLPQDGTLYIRLDDGSVAVVTAGMEIPMSWIDEGRLTYSHSGVDGGEVGLPMGETRDDSFSIRVIDDGGGAGSSAEKTWEGEIKIEIWPNNDDPEWEYPPQDVNIGDGYPNVIDSGHLNLSDPDSPDDDLSYTITKQPDNGKLYIRVWDDGYNDYVYYEVAEATYDPATGKWVGGTSITQSMINNANDPNSKDPVLVYVYDGPKPAEDYQDSINFVVRDGAITSWDNDVPGDDKSHEGGIGSWNPDTSRWELDEQTLNVIVNVPINDEGPGNMIILPTMNENIVVGGDHETQVDEGGRVVITSDDLFSEYESGEDVDNLRYRLQSLPEHGRLLKDNGDGTYTVLTPGTHFYQSDIDDGLIIYQHYGQEKFTDSFSFTVSDGTNDTDVVDFTINIRPVNDTPTVLPGDSIQVDENNAVDDNGNPDPYGKVENGNVLGPNDIRLHDADGTGDSSDLSNYDTPNDLTFVITQLPVHGRLYIYSGSGDRNDMANWIHIDQAVLFGDTQNPDWSGISGYVITMQQLADGDLMYFNDGDEFVSDGFKIVINDNMGVWNTPENGSNSVTNEFTIHIAITPVNDIPRQTEDKTLVVDEGGETIFGSDNLTFTDPDNSPDQITYTITERPENGVVYLYRNGTWVALGVGSSFTQEDIDNGHVKYVHDDTEWHSDSFKYDVSDGDAVVSDNVFTIDVQPVNKPPEVNLNGEDTKYLDVEGDMDLKNWFGIDDPDYDGDRKDVSDEMELTITATVFRDQYFDEDSPIPPDTLFGIISVGNISGITVVDSGEGYLIIRGSMEALREALANLTYRAAHISDPGTAIDINSGVQFKVELNDMNNGGPEGSDRDTDNGLIASATGIIYVSPKNTPPTFNEEGPVQDDPITLDMWEDGRLEVKLKDVPIQITDKDAFDRNNNSVKLSVGNGILWLDEIPGLRIEGNLTGTIVLSGTLEAINQALESLKYVPGADWNGIDQLKVTYDDSANTGIGGNKDAIGVVNIHVHAVNDAPELNVEAPPISLDGDDTSSFQDLNVPGSTYTIDDIIDLDPALNNDPDSPLTDLFELTLELTYKDGGAYFGQLKVDDIPGMGIIYSEDGAKLTLIGTKDNINKALETLRVRMTDQVEENTQFNLRFTLNDHLNGGEGPSIGDDGIIVKDILLLANNENDPAEIFAKDIELDEDSKYVFGDDPITINDPDSLDYSLEISLTVKHGYLNWNAALLQSLGIEVDSFAAGKDANGNNYYTIIGTQDAINAALAALTYTPMTDWNGQDTLEIYVNDRGNTQHNVLPEDVDPRPVEEGGDGLVTRMTVNITIHAKNDSPVANDDTATLPSINEDVPSSQNGGSSVGDLFEDLFDDRRDQKYNAETNPDGSEANGFIGVWVVGGLDTDGKGVWQYQNSSGEWIEVEKDMFLSKDTNIRFQPSQDYNVRRGELPPLQVRLVESEDAAAASTNDLTTGQKYTSGELQRDDVPRYTGIVNLNHEVIPVNDAPELTGPETTAEDPIDLDEDVPFNFTGGNAISITDVDADPSESPDYEMTITLSVDNGTLTLGDATGLSGYNGPSGTLTLTGTLEDINNALATLSYLGNANWYGTDELTITIDDRGNGSEVQDTDELTDSTVIHLRIMPVNDAPEISTSPDAEVLEDGTLSFTGDNLITVSDPDINDGNGDHLMTVTLSGVENGVLNVGSQYQDMITGSANGSGTIELTGTLDEINAALASLTYTPNGDWNGTETLTVTANDNGNYGSGDPQTDTMDITITVIPVNDAPSADADSVTLEPVDEDNFSGAGQSVEDLFSDVFNDGIDNVKGGSDADDFAGIVIVGNEAGSNQGTWQYYDSGTGSWIDIGSGVSDNSAIFLAKDTIIRFVPQPDFNGTPGSLQVRLVDTAPLDPNNPSLTALPENGSTVDVSNNGGTTRYSADVVTLTTTVNAVNDAPTRNGEEVIDSGVIVYYDSDGDYPSGTVGDLISGKFSDSRDNQQNNAPDGSLENDFAGVAITDIPDPQYGTYQYFDGTNWIDIDASLVNDSTALILSKDTMVRFVPNPDNIEGAPSLSAAMRLIDSSSGDVVSGTVITKNILNEDYDQTSQYSDLENQVVFIIRAMGRNTPPFVVDLPDDLEVTERDDPVRLAEGNTVGDKELLLVPELGWDEFSITIRRDGGANADDVFTYFNGTDFVEAKAGDALYYNGVKVGEIVKNSGGEITMKFNDSADQESVSWILGNIGYQIDTHAPPETVTMLYILNDGNYDDRQGEGGELLGYATQEIRIIPVPEDPIAEDNYNYIEMDDNYSGSAGGNVLDNAYDPDGTDVYIMEPGVYEGKYGTLTLDEDGNYTYVLDPTNPDVIALKPGDELKDVFDYRVGDGNDGAPASASLTITITDNISRTITLPDIDPHEPGYPEWDDMEGQHYLALWSPEKRGFDCNYLHLADMSVDKPVVPAVAAANLVSDWEVGNALTTLRQFSIDHERLFRLWGQELLDGVPLIGVSIQTVPADSFLMYQVGTRELAGKLEGGKIASLSGMLSDGSPLPYWIFLDAENGSVTVTPPSGTEGEFRVVIIAEGEDGERAAEGVVFTISSAVPKPPVTDFRSIDSSTERGVLDVDDHRFDERREIETMPDYEPAPIGAVPLAGQIALIGSYGVARGAKTLEKAARDATKRRRIH